MSDLRARLAEALRKHRQGPGPSCRCCGVDYDAPTYTDHLADVLMSLPGIAIVDTTAAEAVAEAICNSHYGDIEAWAITYGRGREHWEKAAKAALLAAANAAESVTK